MVKYSLFLSFLCSIILSSSIIECIELDKSVPQVDNQISIPLNENLIDKLDINLGGFHLQKKKKLTTSNSLTSIHHLMEKSKLNRRSDLSEISRATSSTIHEVIFAIKQNNLDELKDVLYSVSDPKSKTYGKHRTRAQVADITSNPLATSATIKYLEDNGVTIIKQTTYGEYITVSAPISTWETMFNTEFFQYKQNKNDIKYLRAKEYSLPTELHSHVSSVFKTVQHPDLVRPSKKITRKGDERKKTSAIATPSSSCVNTATYNQVEPAFLNCYHDIPSNNGLNFGSQALYESLNQSYSAGDLTAFQNAFNLPVQGIFEVIGGHSYPYACPQSDINNCAEANLDVQYMMAVAQNIDTTYYYDDGDWISWITSVADMINPPLVFSISYSGYEEFISTSYTESFDIEAMKLGVMGVTIFSASGDDGVAGYIARDDPKWCGYNPQFPATSPYVTSVGASQGPESNSADIACQSNEGGVITTGGGFSTLYPTQSWQKTVVDTYLNTATAAYGGYASNGRGYPDISSLGYNYYVVIAGEDIRLSGTSASTPVTAALISLVNSERIAAGKSSLGWFNPALYSMYNSDNSMVNDVTSGENQCTAENVCCQQGFYAAAGWDPLTGLGSLNYTKFRDIFLNIDHSNSAEPTTAPIPTQRPTMAPSQSSGYAYSNTYTTSDCTGTPIVVEGYRTSVCNEIRDTSGVVEGSEEFICQGTGENMILLQNIYSDNNCQDLYEFLKFETGCAIVDDGSGNVYSAANMCSNNAPNLPLDYTEGHILEMYYPQKNCPLNGEAKFDAYLTGYCYNTASGYITLTNVNQPTINYFSDDNCLHGRYPYSQSLPRNCNNRFSQMDDQYGFTEDQSINYLGIASGSLAPSHTPTVAPTGATPLGWVVATSYQNPQCMNETHPNTIVAYTGIPSGVCFTNYDISGDNSIGTTSYMFICDPTGYISVKGFSDPSCIVGTNSLYVIEQGCVLVPPAFESPLSAQIGSNSMMCSIGTDIPSVVTGSYLKVTGYTDSTCQTSDADFFFAFMTGICTKISDVQSFLLTPTYYAQIYDNSNCAGNSIKSFSLNTLFNPLISCISEKNIELIFSAIPEPYREQIENLLTQRNSTRSFSYKFSSHTGPAQPTRKPTRAPTFAPSYGPTQMEGTYVYFGVSQQELVGIDSNAFYSSNVNLVAFQESVSDCLNSLGPTTIVINNPLDTRRRLQGNPSGLSVFVNYTVSFNMAYTTFDYPDEENAFTAFSSTLYAEITGGQFQTYLQQKGGDLASVTCDSAQIDTTYTTSTFSATDDNVDDDSNHKYHIIILIVSIVVVLGVIVTGYILRRNFENLCCPKEQEDQDLLKYKAYKDSDKRDKRENKTFEKNSDNNAL